MKRWLNKEMIENIIANANLSQKEFAVLAGISETHLCDLKRGDISIGVPSRKGLVKAFAKLGKSAEGLFLESPPGADADRVENA